MATYHGKNRVFATASWMSYWRFSFLVVASNFVKWIQNSCHQIKFHTLPFVLLNRVSSGAYVWCICIQVFAINQTTFVSALETLLCTCLSFFSFFCLPFRQNSMLAKKLALNELLVYYSHRCFLNYNKFLDRYFSGISVGT